MFEVKAIIRPQRLDEVRTALHEIAEMPGVTVSKVLAFARSHPRDTAASADGLEADLVKLETVVPAALADRVIEAIQRAATTGRPGDGMVFKIPVDDAVRVRTGEHGVTAL
jgi:nitrogen regulatory protein P-II 1